VAPKVRVRMTTVKAGRGGPRPQRAIVGMFDVLGFRSIVSDTNLQDLAAGYSRLLRLKLGAAQIPVLHAGGVRTVVSPTTIFSDTILIWADTARSSLDAFLASVSVLIAESVTMGWPLRGGIAVGECILDRTSRVFLGTPIVDANETEKAQGWIGAAFHPSCFTKPALARFIQAHDCVRHYQVPVQGAGKPLEWAVHWGDRVYDARKVVAGLAAKCKSAEGAKKYPPTDAYLAATLGP